MVKSTNFTGQPIFSQLLRYISKEDVVRLGKVEGYDRYVKKLDSYTHLVTLLFAVFERYDSIREIVVGLLSNANKLQHLGIGYCLRRSTFAEANARRSSRLFGQVYAQLYARYAHRLADSRLSKGRMRKLYVMDSTTISLFCAILKGAGRNPKRGKKKGGIKAHAVIKADENVPFLVRFTSAATHDHVLLKEVKLPEGSFIVFDKGYVDYLQYERFSNEGVFYVTKLKANARYEGLEELDIPDEADSGIIKDELIVLRKKELTHTARRIAYWDEEKGKLMVFLTNSMALTAEEVVDIYRRRWQIESLFKQLKQNFPLKYFYGDSVNAIESQIWATMIANLLLTLVRGQVRRAWSFSNLVAMVRQSLMSYIDLYRFLEHPEGEWLAVIGSRKKPSPQLRLF